MHESRPKSIDKVVLSLRNLFTFLNDNGTVVANLGLLLSSPRSRDHSVKPTMPRIELIAMTNQTNKTKSPGMRQFAIFSLATTAGLRSGDLASLQLSDIFRRENELRIVQGKNLYNNGVWRNTGNNSRPDSGTSGHTLNMPVYWHGFEWASEMRAPLVIDQKWSMSNYHNQIEATIIYKERLGYAKCTYACYLNDLNFYLTEAGVAERTLSVSDIMP